MVRDFITSGRAIDWILAVLVIEFLVLSLRRPAPERRAAMADLFFALGPGALILLALRTALAHGDWVWIALFLAVSFPVHIGDLIRRRL